MSSWIRAGLAAAACAASSKPSDSGSSSTSTSTASASQTSCGSSGGTNLSVSADGEMRVYVLAGDSAGGYLAFMTALFDSRAMACRKPAGGVPISPLTNICPDRAVCGKARGCLVFPPPAAAVFAATSPERSRGSRWTEPGPLASPVAEDCPKLPPVMIHAGADELRWRRRTGDPSTTGIRRAVRPSCLARTGAFDCGCRKREARHTRYVRHWDELINDVAPVGLRV